MKKILLCISILFTLLAPDDILPQVINNERLFTIENISIEGNKKTRSSVIFENLPFKIGDELTEPEIHAGIENLRKTSFFKEVKLQPRAGSEPGKVHLIIQVKERYFPYLQFKGGFSELNGWYLTPVSVNMDNIFGLGNFTSIDLTFGDRVTSLSLSYINPDIFDSDLDFYFRLKLQSLQFLNYIDDQKFIHQVPQAVYFLGVRSRQKFFKHFLFGWEFYSTMPDSFMQYADSKEKYYDLPEIIAQYSMERQLTSAFSIYFDLDKRDQPNYPRRGWWMGMWLTQSDELGDAKIKFTRFIFDIRKYQNLFSNFVVATRLKCGSISANAPFYEKFYLGGPNSLRGYDDRSLSPVGGGERLLQGGLELRFPITAKKFPEHFLTGVLFFDSGANLLSGEKLNKEKFYSSYGFGLRFRLPFIKLLRMDFAYPIDGGEGKIQFSLGHTF